MKLAVVGSRTFNDYELLSKSIDEVREQTQIDEIVSGGANGADKLAEQYAKENNLKLTIFKAHWHKYGKKAGYIRNKEIWEYVDFGIAFWDGKSKGTAHSFKLSEKFGKELKIIRF
jgi:hypothetical protein